MAIIITGASKGIGKYLFDTLSRKDEKVFGTFNSTTILNQENYHRIDITDYHCVEGWIETLKDELKSIKLINCAGISYNSFAHKSDISIWNKVIQVNIMGTFNVIRTVLPIMREQGYGRIINFSSVVTKLPTPGISAYATSKAALIGLTKSLAIENASRGVTINAINLGYANMGMGINDVPEEYQEKMRSKIPAHRFCKPNEILNTIDYILNTEYLNGSVIDINGGII